MTAPFRSVANKAREASDLGQRLVSDSGWGQRGREAWEALRHFPWWMTARTLRERFREDRLGVAASSLTFTTLMSLVPLFTVGLAVFSAFPVFGRLQAVVQKWLVDSLMPEAISKSVLTYLTQFAGKAGQLGWTGALVFLVAALALVLTIDRKLNDIWRVRRPRPLAQRVLVYWGVLTLGPLLLGASVSLMTWAISANRGLATVLPGGVRLVLDALQFGLMATSMALLFRYVPHTAVKWNHALVGGVLVAAGVEAAKALLGWYLAKVPTYSAVYGAFATVPILLVWVYLLWVMVLLGAVVTAYLPSLLAGVSRQGGKPGWSFQLALELMSALSAHKVLPEGRGLTLAELSRLLRVDDLQLEEPLETLMALDWVARLDEEAQRYVLLADLRQTPLAPLIDRLLLPHGDTVAQVWQQGRLHHLTVSQVLPEWS
jgi:membrane protein